jgi:hypothetical protein
LPVKTARETITDRKYMAGAFSSHFSLPLSRQPAPTPHKLPLTRADACIAMETSAIRQGGPLLAERPRMKVGRKRPRFPPSCSNVLLRTLISPTAPPSYLRRRSRKSSWWSSWWSARSIKRNTLGRNPPYCLGCSPWLCFKHYK